MTPEVIAVLCIISVPFALWGAVWAWTFWMHREDVK